jgi:hypothetical protein
MAFGWWASRKSSRPLARIDRFIRREGALEFSANMQNVPLTETIQTNSNDFPLGKGARGPIPLTLMLEATNLTVTFNASPSPNIVVRRVPSDQ